MGSIESATPSRPYQRVGESPVLLRNVLMNFLAQGWVMVLGMAATPYVVHHLGEDRFGILSILLVLLGYLWFFNRSLGCALIKYVSEGQVQHDASRVTRLIRAALFLGLCLIVGGSVVQLGLARWFASTLFHIPPPLLPLATQAFALGAGIFATKVIADMLEALLQAKQRFDVTNGINTAMVTLQKGLTVALLMVGLGLRSVLIALLLLGAVNMGLFAIWARRLLPGVSWLPRPHRQELGVLTKFSGTLAAGALMSVVASSADKLVLGMFVPIGEVTYYAVAFSLASMVLLVPGNIASVLFAAFSESEALGEQARVRRFLLTGSRYLMALVIPLASVLGCFGDAILMHWMGPGFAERGALPLRIFAFGVLAGTIGWVGLVAVQAAGRPDISTKTHTIQAVLNVVLSFCLIPSVGSVGAASAWTLNHLIGGVVLLTWINRLMRLTMTEFLRAVLVKPLACGIALWPIAMWLHGYCGTLPGLLASVGVFAALSYLMTYVYIFGKAERVQLWSIIQKRSLLQAT